MRGKLQKYKAVNPTHLKKWAKDKLKATCQKRNATNLKNLRHIDPFEKDSRVLLVGEGDFSFTLSLLDHHHVAPEKVVTTSYDSLQELVVKYPQAQQHLSLIEASGAQVIHNVDATKLGIKLKKRKFDHIVFNFPHVGRSIKDQDRNVRANQELLLGFFKSLQPILSERGTVIITLADTPPYTLWDIKCLAWSSGFRLLASQKFDSSMYPGYSHQCTSGGKQHWRGEERSAKQAVSKGNTDSRTWIFEHISIQPLSNHQS